MRPNLNGKIKLVSKASAESINKLRALGYTVIMAGTPSKPQKFKSGPPNYGPKAALAEIKEEPKPVVVCTRQHAKED